MFPLKQRKIGGYTFLQKTFYGIKHTGTDYQANYVTYYLPFSGKVKMGWGPEGGNYLELTRPNGDVLTARHLSKWLVKPGNYTQGAAVAITGNTGAFTTIPHLHQEVKIKGIFVDPEKYNWEEQPQFPIILRVSLILNHAPWNSLIDHIHNLQNWFFEASGQRIQLNVIPVYSQIKNWETEFTGPVIGGANLEIIKEKWFDDFIMPVRFPGSHIVIFNMPRKDWQGTVFDHPELIELGYAYEKIDGTFPTKLFTVSDEHDDYWPYYPNLGAYAKVMAHEIIHLLYGIAIDNDKFPIGTDLTHAHFFGQKDFYGKEIYPMRPEDCFKDYDYNKLYVKTL